MQGGDVKFVAVVTGEPRPEVVWTRGAAMHETNSELGLVVILHYKC